MEAVITEVNAWAWGVPMQVLLLGTGIFLTLGLSLLTWRKLGFAFRLLLGGFKGQGEGDIPPFRALMTSLSATIGTGNIAGVATAMTLGGPGALFWMWLTALFGMAMKYAEAVLAVRYREQDDLGGFSGGPMYYIRNGLGPRFAILSGAFALFGAMAGFGLANTVQSNSVAQVLGDQFEVHWLTTGLLLMVIVGAVILGGIRRIAATASAVVPVMAIAYVAMSALVIALISSRFPRHWVRSSIAPLMALRRRVVSLARVSGRQSALAWRGASSPTRRVWGVRRSHTQPLGPMSRLNRG